MIRPLQRYQLVIDVCAAGLLTLVLFGFTIAPWAGIGDRAQLIAAGVLTLVFGAALAVRRLSPPIALGVAWLAAIVQMLFGLPPIPGNIAIFGILYVTAAYGSRLVYWLGFASALFGAVVITVYLVLPPLIEERWTAPNAERYALVGVTVFIAAALALMLGWTAGALSRAALRARESQRERDIAEAQTVAEAERTRIARDMHDVVAHSLAVVIAQADGARYASASDPGAATAALGTISTTARAALSDVRMLLTQLRHTQADGPQPTLGDLEQLYAQVRAAGVALRVDVDPAPHGEVPAAVQLAVYRILQEALTNALRHGGDGPVDVELAWHDDRVVLRVENPDPRPASRPTDGSAGGHGLVGMRERAQLAGGHIESGRHHGRFIVHGTIPLGGAA